MRVDLILHAYPYIVGPEEIDGIRFLSVEDIIPMKLEAMATRGVKKDFWDVAELLNHYQLPQMLNFYQRRYLNSDPGHILLAMTYFDDAEVEKIDPNSLNNITWQQVKETVRTTVNEYVRDNLKR